MKLLCRVDGGGRSLLARLDLTLPELRLPAGIGREKPKAPVIALAMNILAIGFTAALHARDSAVLLPTPFAEVPTRIGDWQSTEVPLDDVTIRTLSATDYLSRNHVRHAEPPVSVFVSYYESERTGDGDPFAAGLHSRRRLGNRTDQ
jgi:hypothetical protein